MEFTLYEPEYGRTVADNLKYWDRVETDITHPHWDKFSVIAHSIACSDVSYAVINDDGDAVAVGGLGECGCIWMLSTDYIKSRPKEVVEKSRDFLMSAEELGHERVYNYVHENNKTTLRWLKALGFTVGKRNANGLVLVEKYFGTDDHDACGLSSYLCGARSIRQKC